jgi:hypothetical protein
MASNCSYQRSHFLFRSSTLTVTANSASLLATMLALTRKRPVDCQRPRALGHGCLRGSDPFTITKGFRPRAGHFRNGDQAGGAGASANDVPARTTIATAISQRCTAPRRYRLGLRSYATARRSQRCLLRPLRAYCMFSADKICATISGGRGSIKTMIGFSSESGSSSASN